MLKDVINNIKKEKMRKERKKIVKKVALGTISGIAAGVASGVLFAPKSGKETREDISVAAAKVNTKLKKNAATAKENIQNKGNEIKSNVEDAREKISKYLAEKKSKNPNNEAVLEQEEAPIENTENEVSKENSDEAN